MCVCPDKQPVQLAVFVSGLFVCLRAKQQDTCLLLGLAECQRPLAETQDVNSAECLPRLQLQAAAGSSVSERSNPGVEVAQEFDQDA